MERLSLFVRKKKLWRGGGVGLTKKARKREITPLPRKGWYNGNSQKRHLQKEEPCSLGKKNTFRTGIREWRVEKNYLMPQKKRFQQEEAFRWLLKKGRCHLPWWQKAPTTCKKKGQRRTGKDENIASTQRKESKPLWIISEERREWPRPKFKRERGQNHAIQDVHRRKFLTKRGRTLVHPTTRPEKRGRGSW